MKTYSPSDSKNISYISVGLVKGVLDMTLSLVWGDGDGGVWCGGLCVSANEILVNINGLKRGKLNDGIAKYEVSQLSKNVLSKFLPQPPPLLQ